MVLSLSLSYKLEKQTLKIIIYIKPKNLDMTVSNPHTGCPNKHGNSVTNSISSI